MKSDDLLLSASEVLMAAGFDTARAVSDAREYLLIEDATTVGLVIAYPDAETLADNWSAESTAALRRHSLALRRAGQKAWNAYIVLLAGGTLTDSGSIALAAIEEDLAGARKIARGGIVETVHLRDALLSLLPLQNAPKLGAVDMASEIRVRASELSDLQIEAFLSNAESSTVLQILEERS